MRVHDVTHKDGSRSILLDDGGMEVVLTRTVEGRLREERYFGHQPAAIIEEHYHRLSRPGLIEYADAIKDLMS